MASATKTQGEDEADCGLPGQSVRTPVTLVIFIHLFCVAVALYGRQAPVVYPSDGMLKDRLRDKLSFYGQTLGFETAARFDLTQATLMDVDHRIEYLPKGEDPANNANWQLLSQGMRGSDRYQRSQRLADVLAFLGTLEEDEQRSVLATNIGMFLLHQQSTPIDYLRSRRHLLQRPEDLTGTPSQQDPNDATRFQEVYRAQLIDFGNGLLRPQRVEERGQVAPPTKGRN
jgi:hypothetical protein